MQKAIHPLRYLAITQKENGSFSHQGTKAIDYGWENEDSKICYVPYDCVVKNMYNPIDNPLNTLWLESKEPILYADGTIDYMTMLIQEGICMVNTYIGSEFHQGDAFYKMKSHVHIEVGKGKYVPNGWKWVGTQYGIANSYHQADALFLNKDTQIIDDGGYNWVIDVTDIKEPVLRDKSKNQVEVLVENLRCRTSASLNSTILGFVKKGIYDVLSTEENDGFLWFQIAKDQWIAYNKEWENFYEKENQEMIEELKLQIETLEKANQQLIQEKEELLKENNGKLIFECKKDDLYYLALRENDRLYLKRGN